ncbi:cupin domain-containing protein [Candidatus Parcubacteria bacterium]|nr:cupin domain-containing protein [Candidatus Parcubacteria bacterium]
MINTYINNSSKKLNEIAKMQQSLIPPVKFRERDQRVKALLRIRDKGKQILKQVSVKHNFSVKDRNKITQIIKRANHLKRENCLLQISGSFGILKPNQLCIFKEKSKNGIYEVRKYFGLHQNIYYDNGLCVSMAVTTPNLIQNYHLHSDMDEYTMVLSGKIDVEAIVNNKIKSFSVEPGKIILVKKGTVHTLVNRQKKSALNATVKLPLGFQDRIGVDKLPKKHKGYIKIIKPISRAERWGTLIYKVINSLGYKYKIFILIIKPSQNIKFTVKKDTAIYIINGCIEIKTKDKRKKASPTRRGKKDYMVFLKKQNYSLHNTSKNIFAKLYCASEL